MVYDESLAEGIREQLVNACPCQSGTHYHRCCNPFILGKEQPKTPEQLMRSRYSAYAQHLFSYVIDTMTGEALARFTLDDAKKWAHSAQWMGLKIGASHTSQEEGFVTFIASYQRDGTITHLKERSRFIKENGRWLYISGEYL
jgi:SEC-C motif domain protein